MKRLLTILLPLPLLLVACTATPPKPMSYANAERVPINRPVAVQPAAPQP